MDECETVGKGANTVISMLDAYLDNMEPVAYLRLNANNNALVQHLANRTIKGLNGEIELNFMLPGHTKFGPDRMFGHIKRKYYGSNVSYLIAQN